MHTTRRLSRPLAGVVILAVVLSMVPAVAAPAWAVPAELFFSEYVEGSGYNKALEIYNGTGAAVNLAAGGYSILISFNGGSSTWEFNLTGSVDAGGVYVVAPTNATDPTILAQADQLQGTSWFNGDDAAVLRKAGSPVDVIGQVGFDPGTEWGSGLVSTADNTLRRKATVCAGDPDGSNPFDPAPEWDGYANNTFDGLGMHAAECAPVTLEPKINEFSASTAGTDVEWVELYGSAGADYGAYTVLEIEGDGSGAGLVDEVVPAGTADAAGFWLASLPANALENGSLTLLLVKDFSGSLNQDLDTDNDGVLDLTPWSAVADSVAVDDGTAGDRHYGAPVLGPNYDGISSFPPGGASRFPDGADSEAPTDWVRNDFDLAGIPGFAGTLGPGEAWNTPGAPNAVYVAPPEACGDPATAIGAIQGSGPDSPLVGQEVALEGVVVGDFQNNAAPDNGNLNGFHVQDPSGDGDAATSDGIFVYAPGAADVAAGDAVRVRGTVSEFNGMTEVTLSQLWLCPPGGTVLPTALSLPVESPDAFEAVEGMLVTFPQVLTIGEYFDFDRYGEVVLTLGRQDQPTAVYEPGSAEWAALADANQLGRITLDDGRTAQNPDPALHPNGSVFDLSNLFRGGDTLTGVTGVLDYSFGKYRIQPTQGAAHDPANPRPASPGEVGGSLKVASFNLLNYFTTIDTGAPICGPAGDQECRGADTPEEFARQRAKIVSALAGIGADVVGLIEMENHPGDGPTADLVAGLNDALGASTYAYIATGAIGADAIRVALIYRPAAVTPLGSYAILDSSVDPRFLDAYNRPVLAQSFQDNATGGIFAVAVNHLKSKGSDCNAVGDPDLGDGAGNCNLTRTHAAEALVDWLAGDPTGSGDADALILGDLNSYDKEGPIDALAAGGYADLLGLFQGEFAYTYVFDGQLGYLDYALANTSLLDEISGVTAWHINADEPDLIDYDMSFKQDAQDALYAPDAYRASDHDPLVVGLSVCDEIPPTLQVSASPDWLWPPDHRYVTVVASVQAADNFDPNPAVTLVSVTSNEPDDGLGDGDMTQDIVIVDGFTFSLRAERSGLGEGRVYTLTYQATDACGNTALASATVTVPRDRRK